MEKKKRSAKKNAVQKTQKDRNNQAMELLSDIKPNLKSLSSSKETNAPSSSKRKRVDYDSSDDESFGQQYQKLEFERQPNISSACSEESIQKKGVSQTQYKNILVELEKLNEKYNMLSKQIGHLSSQAIEIRKIVEVHAATEINFDSDSFEIKLPCATADEFDDLESKLKSNKDVRQTMTKKFISMLNKQHSITKNAAYLLRYALSRELALKFNCTKAAEGKLYILKDTYLYKTIRDAFVKIFSKSNEDLLSEHTIIKSLASALHHCRDWNGGRAARDKKKDFD